MKKTVIWIGSGVLVVVVVVLLSFGGGKKAGDRKTVSLGQRPVAVEVAPVIRGAIEERRTLTGSLRAGAVFDLSTQIAARLERLMVDLGDQVELGQVVAVLDDDKYRFEVEQARAELEVALANLVEAESTLETRRREYERVRRLREQGVASESELDSVLAEYRAQQARVRVASAQIAQRQAALMGAELMLSYTVIKADWQGEDGYRVVAERYVDEGAYLPAQTPLMSIVCVKRLIAVAHATETDYPRLKLGQEVRVTADAVPDSHFFGTLARLSPVVKETSRQARLEVDVDNPREILTPGMFVRLEIVLDRKEDALVVPRSALIERAGQIVLYVADLEENRARLVEVELGLQDRDYVEIRRPILEGYVVTLGQYLLSDGASIVIHDGSGVEESKTQERQADL